jgi:hypothetical protein
MRRFMMVTLAAMAVLSVLVPSSARAGCYSRFWPSIFTYVQPYPNGSKLVQLDEGDQDSINSKRVLVYQNGVLMYNQPGVFSRIMPRGTGTWVFDVADFDSCGNVIAYRRVWSTTN